MKTRGTRLLALVIAAAMVVMPATSVFGAESERFETEAVVETAEETVLETETVDETDAVSETETVKEAEESETVTEEIHETDEKIAVDESENVFPEEELSKTTTMNNDKMDARNEKEDSSNSFTQSAPNELYTSEINQLLDRIINSGQVTDAGYHCIKYTDSATGFVFSITLRDDINYLIFHSVQYHGSEHMFTAHFDYDLSTGSVVNGRMSVTYLYDGLLEEYEVMPVLDIYSYAPIDMENYVYKDILSFSINDDLGHNSSLYWGDFNEDANIVAKNAMAGWELALQKKADYSLVKLGFTSFYKNISAIDEINSLISSMGEYEQEPNNSQYKATQLTLGESCIGEIGSYEFYRKNGLDTDFYAIDLEKGKYYRLYIEGYNDIFASTTLIMDLISPSNISSSVRSDMKSLGVDYYDFAAKESGTYYIKLYNYFDNTTKTEHYYKISVESINPPTITLSSTVLLYNGKNQRPDVSVKLGNRELKKYTDYNVDYEYTKDIGTYSIIITMRGRYYGTYSKTYSIYYATPTLSAASNVVGGVKLAWGKVNGAEKYRIFRKTYNTSTKQWTSWARLTDTTTVTYTDKTVKSGTQYSYTVRCISSDGKTFTSSYNATGKSITYVAAPSISKVENVNGGVKITWGKVTGAARYRVYRKSGSGSWAKLGDTTAVTYTDKTAKSGTRYNYTVRCLNSAATAFTSSFDSTGKAIIYIAAPTLSSVQAVNGGVQVKWAKSTGAAKYRVYRKTGSSSWTKVADTTATSYTDKTVVSGTKYAYTVRCLSSDAKAYTSSYNPTGKTVTYVSTPVLSSAVNTTAGVKVTWKKPTGAVKFRVYRKTGSGSWAKVSDTTATSYVDSTVVKGKTYSYTVRCLSADGKEYQSYFDTTGKTVTVK